MTALPSSGPLKPQNNKIPGKRDMKKGTLNDRLQKQLGENRSGSERQNWKPVLHKEWKDVNQVNSSHLLNTLVIISVPVDTADSLLYLQCSCAKTSFTACWSLMIYIDYWCFTDRTVSVYIDAHFVCLYCLPAFSLSALRLTKFY